MRISKRVINFIIRRYYKCLRFQVLMKSYWRVNIVFENNGSSIFKLTIIINEPIETNITLDTIGSKKIQNIIKYLQGWQLHYWEFWNTRNRHNNRQRVIILLYFYISYLRIIIILFDVRLFIFYKEKGRKNLQFSSSLFVQTQCIDVLHSTYVIL